MANSAAVWRKDRPLQPHDFDLMVTCEHAGNRVPPPFAHLFSSGKGLLESHRGYDIGALPLARLLARKTKAPLFHGTLTRLLVDLNRSPTNPSRFSNLTGSLSGEDKERIMKNYYTPFHQAVVRHITDGFRQGRRILHLSIHTFTPVLNGVRRDGDIGVLYDPRRNSEKQFACRLAQLFRIRLPELRCRRNYPYRGVADSLTAFLRKRTPGSRYVGLELEVNQRFPLDGEVTWRPLRQRIVGAIQDFQGSDVGIQAEFRRLAT